MENPMNKKQTTKTAKRVRNVHVVVENYRVTFYDYDTKRMIDLIGNYEIGLQMLTLLKRCGVPIKKVEDFTTDDA